jgi:hypothetical protein
VAEVITDLKSRIGQDLDDLGDPDMLCDLLDGLRVTEPTLQVVEVFDNSAHIDVIQTYAGGTAGVNVAVAATLVLDAVMDKASAISAEATEQVEFVDFNYTAHDALDQISGRPEVEFRFTAIVETELGSVESLDFHGGCIPTDATRPFMRAVGPPTEGPTGPRLRPRRWGIIHSRPREPSARQHFGHGASSVMHARHAADPAGRVVALPGAVTLASSARLKVQLREFEGPPWVRRSRFTPIAFQGHPMFIPAGQRAGAASVG